MRSLAAELLRVVDWILKKGLPHSDDVYHQRTMMALLLVAALLGSSITIAMLLSYCILAALVGTPFGGSF
jgi:hypothetical protein